MKRTLCLLCCLLLAAACGAPARAEESGCWYLYNYGTHDFEQTEMRLPTCTEGGYYLLECRICGANELHSTGSATGHSWQKMPEKSTEATCTSAGQTTYLCENCYLTRTESVKALGHDMRDVQVLRSPSCRQTGRMSVRCARCGATDVREIPTTDHQYGDWVVTSPATDHSAGSRQSVCAECGETRSESYYPEGTLMRGSRGEDARALQQLLLDLGILQDVADGIFGAKTESAVKAYQERAGLGADGIAWPQTQARLTADWQAAMGLAPIEAPAGTPDPILACEVSLDENGAEQVLYCDYHQSVLEIAASLEASAGESNALRALKQIRTLWQTELEGLYDEWMQGVPEEEQGTIAIAQATFMNYLATQETALQRQYGDAAAARQINSALERQCAVLCQMLHQEQDDNGNGGINS